MSCSLNQLLAPFGVTATDERIVSGITLDSRQVHAGFAFVALAGQQVDGRDFIPQAVANGASVVLTEGPLEHSEQADVLYYQLPELSRRLPALAMACYEPSRQPPVVGVTGTNGKTSVTHYIATLFNQLGLKAGVLGTLGYGQPGALTPLANTTQDVLSNHRLLAQMGEEYQLVAMEVSSHGLVQRRVSGIAFQAAVFTNLSRDHLDFHGDMAHYGAAKRQLLAWPTIQHAILNADDAFVRDSLEHCAPGVGRYLFSMRDNLPQETLAGWLVVKTCRVQDQGFHVLIASSWGAGEATIPLLGRFNLSNALAAITTLAAMGYSLHALLAGCQALQPVPGRMECFTGVEQPVVVVDYAHTPDALSNALQALREHCEGRLFCIYGCGGDRDHGKRPLMAAEAERLADVPVITADNPRSESLTDIVADMQQGLTQPEQTLVIPERDKAIRWAISEAGPMDMILVAGKGHEDYQLIDGEKRHFSDREFVQDVLRGEA